MTKSVNISNRGSSQIFESKIQQIKEPKEPAVGQSISS